MHKIKIGKVEIDPLMFVDDLDTLAETPEAIREACRATTIALDNLGLQAHPEKSAVIFMGSKRYRDKMRRELEES